MAATAALLDPLRQLGILEPDHLAEVEQSLRGRFPEPHSLAGELVRRGWLTPYQSDLLLRGRGQELVLGSYVLLEKLGEGGMGAVFKARHQMMGRIVALKLIRKERLDNPDAVKRFRREIKAAAQLNHPNIVLAFDADQAGDTHFFTMEYVPGVDLAQFVKEKGPLPVDEACDYIRQAAVGLQHAHAHGMIHRDIKPHNLLLASRDRQGAVPPAALPDGRGSPAVVKILDMGLARMARSGTGDDASSTLTKEGSVMGSLDYIAPEQAMDSHTVDIRADLYSLGCTFYHLLTGRVPFPGGEALAKLMKHQQQEPEPVEKLRPDVLAGVAAVVRKLMAKKPEDRYQTPAELVSALASRDRQQPEISAGVKPAPALRKLAHPARAANANTVAIIPRKKPAARRRPLLLVGASGAALALFAAVLAYALYSGRATPPGAPGAKPAPPSPVVPLVDPAGSVGPRPQLAPGDIVPTFTGLLDEPPPLPGVKRWNLETRYARGLGDACWSPDSKYIAAVSGRQLRIYAAPDLNLVRILPEHSDWIGPIAWSPDGQWLASVDDTVIRLHDARTGKPGPVLTGHTGRVGRLVWIADSKMLASAASTMDKGVFLWSVNGKLVRDIPISLPNALLLAHPKENILVVRSGANLSTWDATTGKVLATLPLPITGNFGWWNDGKSLLAAPQPGGNKVVIWNFLRDDPPTEVTVKSIDKVEIFLVRPGTTQILTGNDGRRIVDVARDEAGPFFNAPNHDVSQFSPDGKWLIIGGGGMRLRGNLQVYAVDEMSAVRHSPRLEVLTRIAWNPKSDTIATDFNSNNQLHMLAIWELADPFRWRIFGDHGGANRFMGALSWDAAGQYLVSDAIYFNNLRLWNGATGEVVRLLDEFKKQAAADGALRSAYSPDGQWLAVGNGAGRIGLFDAKTYEFREVRDLGEPLVGSSKRIQFVGTPPVLTVGNKRWNADKRQWDQISASPILSSPDGKWGIRLSKGNKSLMVQELPNGPEKETEPLPSSGATSTTGDAHPSFVSAWSPNSQLFTVQTDRHGLAIYQREGKFVRYLTGPSHRATAIEFAPDGSPRLAAVGNDHTLRVWNTETGRQLICGVQLSADQAAIVDDQGNIVFGDPAAVERELIYLVEYQDGRAAVLTPTEFRQHFPGPPHDPAR